MALVTVDQIDAALKLDLQDDDERLEDIELKIVQAEDMVIDYLKKPSHGWTEADVPGRVSAAIILAVGALLDDSKADLLAGFSSGDLKNPIVALLYRLRDPALA